MTQHKRVLERKMCWTNGIEMCEPSVVEWFASNAIDQYIFRTFGAYETHME